MSWFLKTFDKIKNAVTETVVEGKEEITETIDTISGKVSEINEEIPSHWKGREELLKKTISKLSLKVETFIGKSDDDYKFVFDDYLKRAKWCLKNDKNLDDKRFLLVPKFISEELFFKNYFYRVENVKKCKNEVEINKFLEKWNVLEGKYNEKWKKYLNVVKKRKEKEIKAEVLKQTIVKESKTPKSNKVEEIEINPIENFHELVKRSNENLKTLETVLTDLENEKVLGSDKILKMKELEKHAEISTNHKKQLGKYLLNLGEDEKLMKMGLELNNQLQKWLTKYIKYTIKKEKVQKEIRKWREDLKKELGMEGYKEEEIVKKEDEKDDEEEEDDDRKMPWENDKKE